MRSYSTRRKKPTEADANVKGYVFARAASGLSYSGVLWRDVRWPEYDRWMPAEFYEKPGDRNRGA